MLLAMTYSASHEIKDPKKSTRLGAEYSSLKTARICKYNKFLLKSQKFDEMIIALKTARI